MNIKFLNAVGHWILFFAAISFMNYGIIDTFKLYDVFGPVLTIFTIVIVDFYMWSYFTSSLKNK